MSDVKTYRAAGYVRLSKEDYESGIGLRAESNSITNQKQMIIDFVQTKQDIELVSMREDDGYSGTDYERPDFQQMLYDIKNGVINCVIVKDLSRFGREYINAGKYIDRLFPYYGVRLIAINDHIDTITRSSSDDFNIMIRNLMNDNYCRDISIKVRSQLQVKRKKGEFLGAFSPYGYMKDEENKNKLVIDPYPAQIVKDIFSWKLNGLSQNAICKRLKAQGILAPCEYKRSKGERYMTPFKTGQQAQWTPVAVRRILTNPVYAGTLVQGVYSRPNFKIKNRILNDRNNWVIVEQAHEPIVSPQMFTLVQRLLELDTRTSPNEEYVYPLAGLVLCGKCHSPMVRKTTIAKGKRYVYYVCSSRKSGHECSGVTISESVLESCVLDLLREHIKTAIELDECLGRVKESGLREFSMVKLEKRLAENSKQMDRYRRWKIDAYEDYKEGVLSKEDYLDICSQFDRKLSAGENAEEQLRKEMDMYFDSGRGMAQWLQELVKYRSLVHLTRSAVAECVESVEVIAEDKLEISFIHAGDFAYLNDHMPDAGLEKEEEKIG